MKKSRWIFITWVGIGMILLILISRFSGTSVQGTIRWLVILYIAGSCIISGVIRRIVKKEKMSKT